MIEAHNFLSVALREGYTFFTGVPCSYLKPFINYVSDCVDLDYIGASSEGEAVAVALGAHLAGKKTIVMCQNSGLGNTVNPLTSLNYPFRVPTLLITTLRGDPEIPDEPQHELMGQVTAELLKTMRIPHSHFPSQAGEVEAVMNQAIESMRERSLPYAFIMKKGTVSPYALKERPPSSPPVQGRVSGTFQLPPDRRMLRLEAIRVLQDTVGESAALIATTGKTGRELFALNDRPNQFYVVGGMGCASGIGLGIQRALPEHPVVVIDGDGAALMKMGTLATMGYYAPKKLVHIVLDNEAHESTGGQKTVSSHVDFAQVAAACSYRRCWRAETEEGLRRILSESLSAEGPVLIHVKIKAGSDPKLGRPTKTPVEVKKRFMSYLQRSS